MANPLTGDFDAVLQVSGGTVNRLLASMHQNAWAKPNLPSFPHSIVVRLGEQEVIDGIQGRLEAQVSVPRIEFVDRADDRFVLDVSIRARYLPDPGTEPFADFMRGNVRAEYRLTDIDPSCRGYGHGNASKYLWFRVVEDSVTFHGTADYELDPAGLVEPIDEPAALEMVTRQLRSLMRTTFSPTPHQVSQRFRRGSMMSLNKGPGYTAVAIPLSPSGPQLGSVDQVVLDGHDFGVAISADYILGQIQPVLEDFRAGFVQHITFHSETSLDLGPFGSPTVLTVNIEYTVTLTSASVEWTGNGFIVRISGQAVTEKSEYNLTFDVTQSVLMSYDAASEGIALWSGGPPGVAVHYGGPFSGDVINTATPAIQSQVAGQVQGILDRAAGRFDLSSYKAELRKQLRTIDENAEPHFEDASVSTDGVVLLGRIGLSPRQRPVVKFEKSPDGSSYTAWDSWIPGGRIDQFDWSWRWAASSFEPSGSQDEKDVFRLRRPYAGTTRYGRSLATTPLPGLDGMGKVCLYVEGAQVDPVTGDLVDVGGGRGCQVYNWAVRTPRANGLVLVDPHHVGPVHPEHPEWGVVNVGRGGFEEPGFNTLVVHVGHHFATDTATTLHEGLAACRRQDAGLAVLVLFDSGHLMTGGRDAADELRALATDLEAPMLVNEDVDGGWAAALGVPESREQPAWRLISPNGGVTWTSDDPVTAETIATALDDYLFPSRPVTADAHYGIDPSNFGPRIPSFVDDHCPPPPVSGHGAAQRAVVFAMAGSTSSDTRLEQIASRRADDAATVVAIVRGATGEEAQAFAARFGEGVVGIPDPDGEIAERAGVRYWPTSLTIDELGIVTSVDVGLDAGEREGGQSS